MKIIIKMPNAKSQIEMYFGSKVSANKKRFSTQVDLAE